MILTKAFYPQSRQWIDLHEKVVLEEDVAENGEQVDENNGQEGCQQDGPAVLGHRLDHVAQRFFSVHYVQHLQQRTHA